MADSGTNPVRPNTFELEADVNVEFNEAASRQQINSGESVKTLFGKIRKFLADLKAVAFSGAYSDLSGTPDLTKYALKSKYGDTTINVGRKAGTDVGARSTAEGYGNTANGNYSHAEGEFTTASGGYSHAEGIHTTASGEMSHAEGNETTASGANSHAEGYNTTASGNCSHAGGTGTKALHDNEVAYGRYNVSNDDTLFSIGDGAYNARHNAFEITTAGGMLHDKDIATTDLIPDLSAYAKKTDIPTELPANGGNADYATNAGNADTLDNLHADDFVNSTDKGQIQIPNNADVPAWIYANGKKYQKYMTNDANIGLTNVPNDSIDWVWYWFDGINIFAREWTTGKYYICDTINGGFSGWKDIYTSGYKPYISGSATVASNGTTCTSNHGFTPSAVIWWDGNYSGVAVSFSDTQFVIDKTNSVGRTINYLIFK